MCIPSSRQLDILRCPITRQHVTWLPKEATIARYGAFLMLPDHKSATALRDRLDGAYATDDGKIIYAVSDDIILMLPRLAFGPGAEEDESRSAHGDKAGVMEFYDTYGWSIDHDGIFEDSNLFEDNRPVASEYITRCHRRLGEKLLSRGQYLLDVACGPIQYEDYVAYSDGFAQRICVDISLSALTAAKQKLGSHGIYILGDITNLPLRDSVTDGSISLHTIYHVPAHEQSNAFCELARVTKPTAPVLIVYSWRRALIPRLTKILAGIITLPLKVYRKMKDGLGSSRSADHESAPTVPKLYFHSYTYHWFSKQDWPFTFTISPWRSVTPETTKALIVPWLFGRSLLKGLYWLESRYPAFFGRHGAYPLISLGKSKNGTQEGSLPHIHHKAPTNGHG